MPQFGMSCGQAATNKTHTHNSVTTDMRAVGAGGEQEESRSSSAGSCGHLATLPCSFTQPGLFPCQQHIVVCLYSSTFSSSLCLSLTLSFPLPLSLSASLFVPLCSNMSLCHLHDDNVFIILTQFQPRRSQTRRETVQQQQEEQGPGQGKGKNCALARLGCPLHCCAGTDFPVM